MSEDMLNSFAMQYHLQTVLETVIFLFESHIASIE
jgi:hypothetical protein